MPQQIQPDSKVLDAKKKSQVAMSMSLVEGLFGVTCFGLKNESYFGCSSKKLFRRGTLPISTVGKMLRFGVCLGTRQLAVIETVYRIFESILNL